MNEANDKPDVNKADDPVAKAEDNAKVAPVADLERTKLLLQVASMSAPSIFPGMESIHSAALRELVAINAKLAAAWAVKVAEDKAKMEAEASAAADAQRLAALKAAAELKAEQDRAQAEALAIKTPAQPSPAVRPNPGSSEPQTLRPV